VHHIQNTKTNGSVGDQETNAKLIQLIVKIIPVKPNEKRTAKPIFQYPIVRRSVALKGGGNNLSAFSYVCRPHRLSTVLEDLVRMEFLGALSRSTDTQP
jgi:hypothetical protein